MKILVFGAGVFGSYICHVLCGNGHDETEKNVPDWDTPKKSMQNKSITRHPRRLI